MDAEYKAVVDLVDLERIKRGASWRDVARDCGITSTVASRFARSMTVSGPAVAKMLVWAGVDFAKLVAEEPKGRNLVISSSFSSAEA